MKKEVTLGIIAILFVAGVATFWLFYLKPIGYTTAVVKRVAVIAKSKDLKTGYIEKRDYWGNPVFIQREIIDEGDAIQYTVTSSGSDGILQTDDDISVVITDVNHTKKIARYIGQRSVRALKGFKEGIRTPDKFQEAEGTDGSRRRPDKKKSLKFWKWKE